MAPGSWDRKGARDHERMGGMGGMQRVTRGRERKLWRQTCCCCCISSQGSGAARDCLEILLEKAARDKGYQHLGQVKVGEHPTCLVWPTRSVSSENLPPGAAPGIYKVASSPCRLTHGPTNIPVPSRGGIPKGREHFPGSLQRSLSSAMAHTCDGPRQGAGC